MLKTSQLCRIAFKQDKIQVSPFQFRRSKLNFHANFGPSLPGFFTTNFHAGFLCLNFTTFSCKFRALLAIICSEFTRKFSPTYVFNFEVANHQILSTFKVAYRESIPITDLCLTFSPTYVFNFKVAHHQILSLPLRSRTIYDFADTQFKLVFERVFGHILLK